MRKAMLAIASAAPARLWLALVITLCWLGPARAETLDEAALWRAVADGGAFAIMRHALAPGTGDPASFRLDDCTTQRNLSAEGRAQAVAIGARFRANGIVRAEVFTSAWCRCVDTADRLGLGEVRTLPALNSFFADRTREPAQTAELKAFLANRRGTPPLVLVSHQVNISALTGRFTRSGGIVVARLEADGRIAVLGTL